MQLKDYETELAGAMSTLKTKLSECQNIMGIIESFLYLVRKESVRLNKEDVPSENGVK